MRFNWRTQQCVYRCVIIQDGNTKLANRQTHKQSGLPRTLKRVMLRRFAAGRTSGRTWTFRRREIPDVLPGIWTTDCSFLQLIAYIVKCTLVQALRLCRGRVGHRGSRGIALLFLDHSSRRGEGSASRPGCSLPPGKYPVPIVQEAGWAPGPVWTGA